MDSLHEKELSAEDKITLLEKDGIETGAEKTENLDHGNKDILE